MRNEGADIVQDHIEEIREHTRDLKDSARAAGTAALDLTKATYHQIQNKTMECSQACDRAIRENPYVALAAALGLGMVLGLLLNRSADAGDGVED
jgi:ElaB/YqjD/DUF883 family membrane-anchored ribosome-binding protein